MSILIFLISLLLCVSLVFLFGVHRLRIREIYDPNPVLEQSPAELGLVFEDIEFQADDNALLHGWWIPHPEASGSMIFCHGKGGHIGDRLWLIEALREIHPMNLFIFDYRGFGKSTRSRYSPTEPGLVRDTIAAYEVVRAFHGDADQPPIVAFGRSLGGAVALQMAFDRELRGIVLENVFSTLLEMAEIRRPGWPHGLLREKFDNLSNIKALRCPLLQLHAREDEVVPFAQGQAVFAEATCNKQWVETSGNHVDAAWLEPSKAQDALRQFLQTCLPAIEENPG